MKQGMLCTNAFANAFRSADGIPACIAGIPCFMDEAFTTSPYADNSIESMPALLHKIGYTTSFFHGGTNGTMSFDIFSKNAGFDSYVGRTQYNNDKDYDGTWGIWDEAFLQFYARALDKEKQPFFSTVFTLSSHEPFHLPQQYSNTPLAKLKGIERGIAYSDMALRKFFETASTKTWYANTLFILTADHNFMANIDTAGYYNNGMGLYSIPLLFFHPANKNLAGINTHIVQQIDILPSVMDYIHYPNNFFAYGNSIFDLNAHRFAYTQMEDHRQFLSGQYALTSDNDFVEGLYNFKNDSLMRHKIYEPALQESLEHVFKQFRQLLQNTIIDNRQTAETFQKNKTP
jgi:phosphoglycerol transferase MdoB-like AlkP superfamily enzyme